MNWLLFLSLTLCSPVCGHEISLGVPVRTEADCYALARAVRHGGDVHVAAQCVLVEKDIEEAPL